MRAVLIILFLTILSGKTFSQGELGDCVRRQFLTDSLGRGMKNPAEDWNVCLLGKKLPDFTVVSIGSDTIKMSNLAGKVIVLNFWSIDCHPCIAEMPGMNKLVEHYKNKDVFFLALTWETLERIRRDFLPRFRFDFEIVAESMPLINDIWGSGFPTTYIIDKDGFVRKAWSGGRIDEEAGKEYYEKTRKYIDKLLTKE